MWKKNSLSKNAMNNLRILHLANDEKFIDQAVRSFEHAAPAANDLYIYASGPLQFVKTPTKKKISFIPSILGSVASDFSRYDLIVVHSLNSVWWRALSRAPEHIPIVWLGWGYDYYDLIFQSVDRLFLPLTKDELQSKDKKNILKRVFSSFKQVVKKIVLIDKEVVVERVNYFAPVLPDEYLMVKRECKGLKFPSQVTWNYGNLEEDLIKGFSDEWVLGENILIGNSATAENNHLDTFSLLSKAGVSNRTLVTPLSYGKKDYREIVIGHGQEIFGDKFSPLIDFMPIGEYIKILLSCGYVIMNHVRQQAVGNIVIMLYLGAKVFLREESPTYSFFRGQGAVIHTIQDLEKDPGLLTERLDPSSMQTNRDVVIKNWAKTVCERKTLTLLEHVCGFKKANHNSAP